MMPIVYSVYAAKASIGGLEVCLRRRAARRGSTMSSDHSQQHRRGPRARTPSMSPITTIGSGAAMSRTKSHSPRSHTASMSVSHSARSTARWSVTRCGVKPLLTSLRRSRCCGSSMSIIIGDRAGGRAGCRRRWRTTRVALGLDHRLIRRRGGQARCGPGTPARSPASTCRRARESPA